MPETWRHYRSIGRKLLRLGEMGPFEIAVRGRQTLAMWLERAGVLENYGFRTPSASGRQPPGHGRLGALFARHEGGREAAEDALARFRREAPMRFFAGAGDPRSDALLERRAPGLRARIVAAAEEVCAGHFDLLGYKGLSFGDPIDWHLDPVSGRRAPEIHWSRIDYLDPGVVGDSKVVWELNRHQWLILLGQAWRCTGDARYGETFARAMRAWMAANPPGVGINWTSSLEAAVRLISWCWALYLFRDAKALDAALFAEMLAWIRAHALRTERYLSYYFSPNTHLTGEALGLFYAAAAFPELAEAPRWRALGKRILADQVDRQVFTDGVYFEQSTSYQRYTTEFYLHFLILAARQGVPVPAAVSERVQRMVDFLLAVRWPDGSMPCIGDADGGALLPLVRRAPGDFRNTFALAAVLFGRGDYAWAAGGATPELVWLLGAEGCEAFDALPATPPSAPPSRLFSEGGYAVMRSGWGARAHQLIFDVGPLGCAVSGGHGHADLLAIQCAVSGAPCLVDPGTYIYTGERHWRDYFRGTAAHSTVTVDGLNQAVPEGPFKWRQRPQARLRHWVSTPDFDLADADHDAYRHLPDPVLHRRRVLFVKPRYWVIVDDLEGKAEHRIDLRFQFAPMEINLGGDGWVMGQGCRLLVTATAPLQTDLAEGRRQPLQGWMSPDYGQRRPAPMLIYSAITRLPLRVVSLIFPADQPPAVVAAALEHRRIDLLFEDCMETLHIGDRDMVMERLPHAVTQPDPARPAPIC
jgi:hypothetical protein